MRSIAGRPASLRSWRFNGRAAGAGERTHKNAPGVNDSLAGNSAAVRLPSGAAGVMRDRAGWGRGWGGDAGNYPTALRRRPASRNRNPDTTVPGSSERIASAKLCRPLASCFKRAICVRDIVRLPCCLLCISRFGVAFFANFTSATTGGVDVWLGLAVHNGLGAFREHPLGRFRAIDTPVRQVSCPGNSYVPPKLLGAGPTVTVCLLRFRF